MEYQSKHIIGEFPPRSLRTHSNISKRRGETPVKLILGSRMRLQVVTHFDMRGPIFLKANENKGNSSNFHNPEGLENFFRATRKLESNYSGERQTNCEIRCC